MIISSEVFKEGWTLKLFAIKKNIKPQTVKRIDQGKKFIYVISSCCLFRYIVTSPFDANLVCLLFI